MTVRPADRPRPGPDAASPASGRAGPVPRRLPSPRELADLSRPERVRAVDAWLAALLGAAASGAPAPPARRRGTPKTGTDGVALLAVGSLGREELPPHGDLDLVLVHAGRPEIGAIADALWYPIWDAGLRLDHSVRTVSEEDEVTGIDSVVHAETAYDFASLGSGGGTSLIGSTPVGTAHTPAQGAAATREGVHA